MKLLFTTSAALLLAANATWADTAPGEVMFEDGAVMASLTGVAGDAANGRAVFLNRKKGNCLACHQNTDLEEQPFHGEVGPVLDGAADRWNESDLRGLLANSKMMFEGTIMPAFYRADGFERNLESFEGKTILSAQEVEDVLAYLLTLTE